MAKSLLQRTLDALGADIVAGRRPEGHVVASQELEKQFGVSRSVVKETVRVLQTIGMVSSVKRVGVRVLPAGNWNYFDPLIIRWRLESDRYGEQLRSLNELRGAIEPSAASLAAQHAPDSLCAELLALAGELRSVVRAGHGNRFIEVDVRFHSVILEASGNEMFALLGDTIGATVSGRSDVGLLPNVPDEKSLQLHVNLADAIQRRRPNDAHTIASNLIAAISAEIDPAWADAPRPYPGNVQAEP